MHDSFSCSFSQDIETLELLKLLHSGQRMCPHHVEWMFVSFIKSGATFLGGVEICQLHYTCCADVWYMSKSHHFCHPQENLCQQTAWNVKQRTCCETEVSMYALLGSCDQVTGKQASTSLSAQQWEGVGEKEDVGRRVSRTPSEVKSKVRKTEHAMCLLKISGILRNGDGSFKAWCARITYGKHITGILASSLGICRSLARIKQVGGWKAETWRNVKLATKLGWGNEADIFGLSRFVAYDRTLVHPKLETFLELIVGCVYVYMYF